MNKSAAEKLIESRFSELPPKLQQAARYILANPSETALESMRTLAAKAGLQPGSMLRLAKDLGFDSYESLRQIYREWLSERDSSFTERATALRRRGNASSTLISEILATEVRNLDQTFSLEQAASFDDAVKTLSGARQIYVVGIRSLFPAAYCFSYVCGMFLNNTTLLTGVGNAYGDELRRIGPDDALVAFSYDPYARDTVAAVNYAKERGAKIVSITDSVVSPIAGAAQALIVVSNASPSLFPSVLPALATAQALAALLIANSNDESLRQVANSEEQLKRFNVYVNRKTRSI